LLRETYASAGEIAVRIVTRRANATDVMQMLWCKRAPAGTFTIPSDNFAVSILLVLRPGDTIELTSAAGAHVMPFGGASQGSKRHIWWNFVSSSRERIERAKEESRTGKFDIVPGDTDEFIPLPQRRETSLQ
jgi:hypothetical protein